CRFARNDKHAGAVGAGLLSSAKPRQEVEKRECQRVEQRVFLGSSRDQVAQIVRDSFQVTESPSWRDPGETGGGHFLAQSLEPIARAYVAGNVEIGGATEKQP